MIRFAAIIACLAGQSLYAIDPDPSKLLPTADQAAKAVACTTKLGDPNFSIRDKATKELKKLGTASLPILQSTLETTADPEVRSRCEILLPAIELANLKLRLATFLADTENQYDHKLPAWEEFRAVVGNGVDAKKLYAGQFESTQNRELLTHRSASLSEFTKLVLARRMTLYNRSVNLGGAVLIVAGGRMIEDTTTRLQPTVADTVALLFAEAHTQVKDRAHYYAVSNLLHNQNIRTQITAPDGAPFRKLIAHWMDTRENPIDMYNVMSLAASLNIKEAPVGKYAERLLTTKTTSVSYRMYAITTLARTGDKAHLPILAKAMADETELVSTMIRNGQREERRIQVRDIALAMSLIMTGQKPEDYGIEFRSPSSQLSNIAAYQYSYMYYKIPDDKTRTEAFKKWAEWEAKQKMPEAKK